MSARTQVHHQRNMFDSASSDFSTDSDSSSGGDGDFMDKYITETGAKPMQMDDEKPKVQKQQDAGIPDMASLFGDTPEIPEAKPKTQEPWRSPSADSNADNMFGGSSFGNFDAPAKDSFNFDKPAPKPSNTDDMTNLFGGNTDSAPPAPVEAAPANSDSGSSGWPWDTHAKKKDGEGRRSRDLWSSHSDSDSSNSDSSNSASSSSDMTNMFAGSSSGSSDSSSSSSSSASSSDSSSSHSLFDDWSSFGGKPGVSQPAQAPQQQDDAPQRSADSPIQGPTQREGSISGASATDQVVDVRLSSELQQSLLQARSAESRMLQNFRGVAN